MKDICVLIIESNNISKLVMDLSVLEAKNVYQWLDTSLNKTFSFENIFPVPKDLETPEEITQWKIDNWGCSSDFEDLTHESMIREGNIQGIKLRFKTSGGAPYKIVDELVACHPDASIIFFVYSEYSGVITKTTADPIIYVKETINPKDLHYSDIKFYVTADEGEPWLIEGRVNFD